ncbi:unnamed protein product [Paramecium primaurelia]|uniref:Uncharacterized protein n=1 Tax=Paramecium primaurelia TaxID=5886 RepID=A0A8S1NDC7_PARPR|nr:unnamed protein product [Paramecium primaurelia]
MNQAYKYMQVQLHQKSGIITIRFLLSSKKIRYWIQIKILRTECNFKSQIRLFDGRYYLNQQMSEVYKRFRRKWKSIQWLGVNISCLIRGQKQFSY